MCEWWYFCCCCFQLRYYGSCLCRASMVLMMMTIEMVTDHGSHENIYIKAIKSVPFFDPHSHFIWNSNNTLTLAKYLAHNLSFRHICCTLHTHTRTHKMPCCYINISSEIFGRGGPSTRTLQTHSHTLPQFWLVCLVHCSVNGVAERF